MKQYLDMRLPSHIPHGIKYGYKYTTEIVTTKSVNEYRRQSQAEPLLKTYSLLDNIYNFQEIKKMKEFFCNAKGKLCAFRFHDIFDNRIEDYEIGTGDGLKKEFSVNLPNNIRLYFPHQNSLKIKLNGKIHKKYVFENGLIKFEKAPRKDKKITVDCSYDIAVRFAEDDLDIICEQKDLYRIEEIKLISLM